MNTGPREWDAETYDRVSDPQYQWGLEVLDRLELKGDETVIDAGCGSGRVTEKLLERLLNGQVIGVDGSTEMVGVAEERFAGDVRASFFVSDLLELTPALLEAHGGPGQVDVVFSTATFHWIQDHGLLFSRIHSVLRPEGRLVAQCGGEGNVARHAQTIATVGARPEFRTYFEDLPAMWNFAPAEETAEKLRAAGFKDVHCELIPKFVTPEQPYEFLTTVTLGPILARLPEERRRPFAEAVIDASDDPLTLDYVRLNIDARRA
ncbi:MAG TPA: methyltransferase domain-containing protein [Solirubrobacterales bacterium]